MSPTFRSFCRYFAIIISFCLIFSLIGPNFTEAAPGVAGRTPKEQTLTVDVGELPSKLPKQKLELTSKRTHARYRIQGDTLKEDLILQKYNQNTFTFELKANRVKPVVGKDGSISFTDSKSNKVWSFKNLFMTDANGKYSDKVSLKLREENGKTYVYVVADQADQAFLQDKDTKYPVTIDPSIDTWDVQRDNFVASSFPTSI